MLKAVSITDPRATYMLCLRTHKEIVLAPNPGNVIKLALKEETAEGHRIPKEIMIEAAKADGDSSARQRSGSGSAAERRRKAQQAKTASEKLT